MTETITIYSYDYKYRLEVHLSTWTLWMNVLYTNRGDSYDIDMELLHPTREKAIRSGLLALRAKAANAKDTTP